MIIGLAGLLIVSLICNFMNAMSIMRLENHVCDLHMQIDDMEQMMYKEIGDDE